MSWVTKHDRDAERRVRTARIRSSRSARVWASTEANGSSISSSSRLVGERAGDGDALLHAAGELPRVAARRSPSGRPRRAPRSTSSLALGLAGLAVLQRQRDVAARPSARAQRAAVVLEDERHLGAAARSTFCPSSSDRAAGRREQAGQALAAASSCRQPDGPDDADELARVDVKVMSRSPRRSSPVAVGLRRCSTLEHRQFDPPASPLAVVPARGRAARPAGRRGSRRSRGCPAA